MVGVDIGGTFTDLMGLVRHSHQRRLRGWMEFNAYR